MMLLGGRGETHYVGHVQLSVGEGVISLQGTDSKKVQLGRYVKMALGGRCVGM